MDGSFLFCMAAASGSFVEDHVRVPLFCELKHLLKACCEKKLTMGQLAYKIHCLKKLVPIGFLIKRC